MKKKNNGVSLIVLTITIILTIIMAGVGISVLVNRRYFEEASYASFLSSFEGYKEELEDYIGNQEFLNNGRYDRKSLNADKNHLSYKGVNVSGKTIKDIIKTLNDSHIDQVIVENGNLKYTGSVQKIIDQVNIVTN